jgi:hypothetical protein
MLAKQQRQPLQSSGNRVLKPFSGALVLTASRQVDAWCIYRPSCAQCRPRFMLWACIPLLCHRNLLSDLVYTSQADVLLGLHGDSMYWGFFMAQHSSVVEIRPRGFAGPQANQHMKVSAAVCATDSCTSFARINHP